MQISSDVQKNATKTTADWTPAMLVFLLRHPIECLAIAITLIGILGYAAGESFNQGWNWVAGIPPSLFPIEPYETVLRGLSLESPWLYSAVALACLFVYLWLLGCLDAWQERRKTLVRVRRRPFERRSDRRKRRLAAIAARAERQKEMPSERTKGSAFIQWRALGKRGRWRDVEASKEARVVRNQHYIRVTAWLIIQLVFLVLTGIVYWMVKTLVLQQARADGARQFIGIYAAVTGSAPTQFGKETIPLEKLIEYACEGYSELSKYRVIQLDISTSSEEAAVTAVYVLKATDKVFLLMGKNGSTIHSFGDGRFSLHESTSRPVSDLIKSCRE